MKLKKDKMRLVVAEFVQLNPDLGKSAVVRHFAKHNVSRATVYRICSLVEHNKSLERKPGSGKKATKMPPRKVKQLLNSANETIGVSTRKLAHKYGISPSYSHKLLQNSKLQYRLRQTIPAATEKQKATQHSRLLSMERTILNAENPKFVLDDETYFTFAHDGLAENKGFYTANFEEAPYGVKFRPKQKFATRLLMWIAVSEKGISPPFFLERPNSINAQIYITECIMKRLVPFLNSKFPHGDYIFWPDLASAHYATDTLNILEANQITFVPKKSNPPNVPQLRPIEDFFGQLKAVVYQNGWRASDTKSLRRRICWALRTIDITGLQRRLENLPRLLRQARRKGVTVYNH